MKLKFLLYIAVAILITLTYVGGTTKASVSYAWAYTGTNVYNDYGTIFYELSGLTIGQEYRWDLYSVDPRTGSLLQSLDFNTLTPTTTTSTMYFGAPITGPYGPNDRLTVGPEGFQGPVAVVDSNGTILGRHYVASNPGLIADSGWLLGTGNTAVNEKQVVGNSQVNGYCQNPAAAPINSDGWQHTFKPCSVATLDGDYAILHYQIDPTYVGPTTERMIFFEIPTVDVEMTVYIDDILSYQTTSNYAGTDCACVYYSFLIVNTSGNQLPFTNRSIEEEAFVTGDNPMRANFDPGVYNYSRNDGGGWVSDGESVWIVTLDPSRNEWTMESTNDTSLGGRVDLTTHAVTSAVWDSYHGYQEVADSTAGFSDSTVYAFARSRNFSYLTDTTAADDVVAQWINRASAINSGLATPTEMEFEVQAYYDIVDTSIPTFEETVNTVIENIGFDTDAGSAILLALILFFGMIATAGLTGLSGNIYAYLIVWTGLGATFVIGGFGSVLVDAVYTIMTIGMWVFAMLIGGVLSENDG